MSTSENEDATVFRILISSDNHLGYLEKDGVRGSDSIRTFEEILSLAQSNNVDFILFGGDIFHENRPSLRIMHEAMRLLRQYCFSDKPIRFQTLSDPSVLFANTAFAQTNYMDSHLNVGIPVFSIHGNHDDPNGPGGLCAIDLLHTAGLVNLFGKTASVEQLYISPLLLQKGSTRLAVYGLGAMREERAHRLFLHNQVTFYRPTEKVDDWFSMCVVHQNRVRHGPTNYLPENCLPNFLDLVVWGHEHECRIEPEWNSSQNFYVSQPGSSVATAMSGGEALPKAVGLLEVRGKEFKLTKLPLKTVRPFVFRDLTLEEESTKTRAKVLDMAKEAENICTTTIEDILTDLETSQSHSNVHEKRSKLSDDPDLFKTPVEPLIRLRVDLSGGYESFSSLRFGQRFIGRVANPKDLISFNHNREKQEAAQARRALTSGLSAGQTNELHGETVTDLKKIGLDVLEVEKLVRQYLNEHRTSDVQLDCLTLFTACELGHSLRQFVDKDSRDAIQSIVESVLLDTVKHLRKRRCPVELISRNISTFCQSRLGEMSEDENEAGDEVEEKNVDQSLAPPYSSKSKISTKGLPINTVEAELQSAIMSWSSDEDRPSPIIGSKRPKQFRQNKRNISPKSRKIKDFDVDEQIEMSIEDDDSPPRLPSNSFDFLGCDRSLPSNSTAVRGRGRRKKSTHVTDSSGRLIDTNPLSVRQRRKR